MADSIRPIRWVGSSLDDLKEFPEAVLREVGYALYLVQLGEKPNHARLMEGFKGASVLKIVEDFDGSTYRIVYTVKFEEAVYVLHAFQKKSKTGISTPQQELNLVKRRFKIAEMEHKRWQEEKQTKS